MKLSGDKLERLLQHLGCREDELPDFGYYPTGKKGEYLQYESDTELRDTENVPLKENIHAYPVFDTFFHQKSQIIIFQ